MKRRVIHALQKYVFNPPIKLLFVLGIVPPGYALLETIGRTTGKPRCNPVGDGRVGAQFWIVAEHGREAGYVRNIMRNPRVRVKVREGLRTLAPRDRNAPPGRRPTRTPTLARPSASWQFH